MQSLVDGRFVEFFTLTDWNWLGESCMCRSAEHWQVIMLLDLKIVWFVVEIVEEVFQVKYVIGFLEKVNVFGMKRSA